MIIDRRSYQQGFEDALELLLLHLRRRGITVPKEVIEEVDYLLTAIREDKLDRIRKELGIL